MTAFPIGLTSIVTIQNMSVGETNDARSQERVLFVAPETGPGNAVTAIAHLAGYLKHHNWNPAVMIEKEGVAADLLRTHAIEFIIEPELLVDSECSPVRALASRFDLVVVNGIASEGAVRAALSQNVPVVWYLHETVADLRLVGATPQLQSALGQAHTILTPTRAIAEVLQPFAPEPIEVVPYGIPEVKAHAQTADRPFTFLALTADEPNHGRNILIEAINDLHPDLRWCALFQMAGVPLEKLSPDDFAALSASMPNLQLVLPKSRQEIVDLMSNADVVVCALLDEMLPIVLLEAMSMGKAIICTGVSEWLQDGRNALLVTPKDSRALAIALARCIADRDLVDALGTAAKQTFVEHFQLDVFGRRFVAIAEKTIGRAVKRTPADYGEWVELYETLGPADRSALRRQLNSLGRQPLISALLSLYNPDLALLAATIDSLKQQIYEHWELCIADDASTDTRVRPFLKKAAADEARIRITLREEKGQMAASSNSALVLATGEWCAFLDQDDMLAEHALAKIALEIDAHSEAGLIYSDEDKIDVAQKRSHPFFKTDWNPEFFFGENYVGHLAVYRTDVLRAIGGFREEFEGSQEYDLALRCIGRLESEQIRHIPRVLYHGRMVSGRAAEKPYATETARRAIADHLQREGIAGRAEACPGNIELHRVIYDLPDPVPRVDIVIHRVEGACAGKCAESIRNLTNYPSYEIAVANDRLQLNELATATTADIVLFLHADIIVINGDWLREMVSHAARPQVGAVGARLWRPDDTLQHSGYILGLGGVAGVPFTTASHGHAGFSNWTCGQRNCSAVSSACLATRAAVFRELNGFDNQNLTSNYQDIDLCLRAREHGLQVIWTPYANLVHDRANNDEEKNAEKQVAYQRDTAYMQERWGEELRNDPFYSPNLSLLLPGFELAFPPRWFLKDV